MNANDYLSEYTSTDHYYQHMFDVTYTDGVKAMAETFECYWFIDVITSYQPELKEEDFQVWTLNKHLNSSCTIKCTNGNDKVLKIQEVPFTDFIPTTATVWCVFTTILLPSEY